MIKFGTRLFPALVFFLVCSGLAYSAGIPFDNYHVFLKGEIGGGAVFGDIMKKEVDSWKLIGIYSDGTRLEGSPENYPLSIQLGGEVLWNRFGFILSLVSFPVDQSISIGNSTYERKSYLGTLISMSGLMTGFNYYFVLGDLGDLGSEIYIGPKVGYLWGTLNPYPTYVAFSGLSIKPFDISGLSVGGSLGYQVNYYNFLLGVSLNYYQNMLNTTESLSRAYEGLDNSVNFGMFACDFYIGVGF